MVEKIERGVLLIASPGLLDPNFRRTVVLICEHTPQGSLGLVLNRVTPHTLAEACAGVAEAKDRTDRIHAGGPVQPDHLLVLHREKAMGGQRILDGVHLVGDAETLKKLLEAPPNPDGVSFRCYAGYAGWGEGQLASEIAEGAWVTVDGDAHLVFDVPVRDLWSEALRKKGGAHRLMAEMPVHPEFN